MTTLREVRNVIHGLEQQRLEFLMRMSMAVEFPTEVAG